MAIDLFQIDKAGDDPLTKDYTISVVLNKERVFVYKIPQNVQDVLINEFKKERLGLSNSKHGRLTFKLRIHCTIIILIIKEILKKNNLTDRHHIELCNDYDGHIHEIKDMLFKNLKRDMINLNKEDIVRQKFDKNSLVNMSAYYFYTNNLDQIKDYYICKFKIEDLRDIIKKW